MRRIVKQPNGKFAVFSSVVDHFVFTQANEEDLITFFENELREEYERQLELSKMRIKDRVEKLRENKPYPNYPRTFDECLDFIESVHGKKELEKVKESLSKESGAEII